MILSGKATGGGGFEPSSRRGGFVVSQTCVHGEPRFSIEIRSRETESSKEVQDISAFERLDSFRMSCVYLDEQS